MAEIYEVGKDYYLPVSVIEIMDSTYTYPVRIEFENGNGCMDGRNAIKGNPNLLLTAEEIAGLFKTKADAMTVTADSLQEENKKLKHEFKDAEGAYDVVEETSIKRKKRITTMEEVIVALVEKIRRLEGDD